ncbi:MAG: hypothetical protein ABIY46_05290, partial [Gemmatimonadales bacterium]
MHRLRSVSLSSLLALALAAACTPTEPTRPSTTEVKATKPGGGGTGPVGQPLGAVGGSKAYAVNGSYAVGRDGTPSAVAWDASGTTIPLPVDGSVTSSTASGINQASTIVGSAGPTAAVWQTAGPGAWAPAVPLPNPAGSWSSTWAYAVNDQGQIAGTGTRTDNLKFALRWTPSPSGYLVEVAPAAGAEYEFVGHAIANGSGWVTGWVRRNVGGTAAKDAFVWTASGTFRLLARYGGAATEARGINASGRIVGWSATAPRGGDSSPVTWSCTEAACTPPTVLPAFYRNLNYAFSINDAGDIVGTSGLDAILYSRCGGTVVLHPP